MCTMQQILGSWAKINSMWVVHGRVDEQIRLVYSMMLWWRGEVPWVRRRAAMMQRNVIPSTFSVLLTAWNPPPTRGLSVVSAGDIAALFRILSVWKACESSFIHVQSTIDRGSAGCPVSTFRWTVIPKFECRLRHNGFYAGIHGVV